MIARKLFRDNSAKLSGRGRLTPSLLAAVSLGAYLTPFALAGLHPASVSAGNVPWTGGVVPYVFDPALSVAQRETYLDGLREYELAANVQFIPRLAQTRYVLFKYSPTGPNRVSETDPVTFQTVEISLLTRGQICHEMGHSFGLDHEHQRSDRDGFIQVLYGNVVPGNNGLFDISPGTVTFGAYDFESVMHYSRDVLSIEPGVRDTLQPKPGFEKYQRRMSNLALSPTDRALMASLYGAPPVPLSSVVTTTGDGGSGSLRAALYFAADHPGTTITFNIPQSDQGFANGAFTIKPTGHLPPMVTNGTIIDASTQPGYVGKPRVFLNGSKLLPEAGSVPGLLFYEANCTVRGLGFQQFPWNGISMIYPDATGNRIVGCSCGVDATGNAALPNAFQGVFIADGAQGNIIGGTGPNDRNVFSGNSQYGIWISGATTTGNSVLGNFIGTNLDGGAALGNQVGGIILTDGATLNTIGGATPASRNVVSGNTDSGVWITGGGVSQNTVQGNYVGLNAAGTAALGNTFSGMNVLGGATDNLIVGNVISGNAEEGLRIADEATSGNQVYGNFVGTGPDGNIALPNGFGGVTLLNGATGNRIGGTSPGQRNILSGNGSVGLVFGDDGTQGNFAYGNHIGTNAAGTASLPNGFAGVYLTGGCSANYLGDGPGTGNLISGNGSVGVLVADPGTTGNFIRNNRIGPDALGGVSLTNQFDGIRIQNSAQATRIGGTATGHANVIRGNGGQGIIVFNAGTAGHTFERNSISANGGQGIVLIAGTNHSQSAPVISSASLATGTTVSGSLNAPNGMYRIEFFASPGSRTFVGETQVTTMAGSGTFNAALPAIVAAGRTLTATATSLSLGDTSQFSNSILVTSVDGDSDGLPNAYESATPGLNPANPLDAALDTDGDGFSNLQEFVSGTNPNSSTSRLSTSGTLSAGSFQISLATVAGKFYRIDRSDSLAGAWESVALHVAGTGGPVQVFVPVSLSAPRQFFRVTDGE